MSSQKKIAANSEVVDTTDLLAQLLETAKDDGAPTGIHQNGNRSFGKREFERSNDRSASTAVHRWSPTQSPAKKVTKSSENLSSDDRRTGRSNGPLTVARDVLKSEENSEVPILQQVSSSGNHLSYDEFDMPDDGFDQLESSAIDMLCNASVLKELGADAEVATENFNFETNEWISSSSSATNEEQDDTGCPVISRDDNSTTASNKLPDGTEDENFSKMYWLDAYEDPKHSGISRYTRKWGTYGQGCSLEDFVGSTKLP